MPRASFTTLQRAQFVKQAQGQPFSSSYLGTATASAAAATCNSRAGLITSEALTTAGLAAYTLTVTCDHAGVDSIIFASLQQGTNTQGTLGIATITPAAGSFVVIVRNLHASQALNGSIKIAFSIENPS